MDLRTDAITGDLVLDDYQLQMDDTLRTAILLSLHSDGRHEGERGFWGEVLIAGEQRFGSRLWTLRRSHLTTQSIELARQYALEALAWLVADGYARQVDVTAQKIADGVQLNIQVAGQAFSVLL